MKKNTRWKLIFIALVIILCLVASIPLSKKIHLGLDLKGGMHLALQVMSDDAIENETNNKILETQQKLKKKNLQYGSIIKKEGKTEGFYIINMNIADEDEILKILKKESGDWEYKKIGSEYHFNLKPNVVSYLKDQAVRQAMQTLRNRVDEYGLSEIPVQRQGTGERIIVELPGVENPDRIKEILKRTAFLEWKLSYGGPFPSKEALLESAGGKIPDDREIVEGEKNEGNESYYILDKVAVITGSDLNTVKRTTDEWNTPAISFTLKSEGGKRFEKFTGDNIGEALSIVLDNKVQEVANIKDKIPAILGGIINGNYTTESAEDLVVILRAGALPAEIKVLEDRTIGPSLGADSVRKGLLSISLALILIMVFLVFYYKLSGINALIALLLNILILMGALAYFKANLTLPGIAGIILTIGMAVDANVLVFERIREELAAGKSVVNSISSGFRAAFRTILDANITTIITAIFLFQFGTGPIRGFAITLIIGITASMFTAVFVSRTIFDVFFPKGKKREKLSI